MASKSEGERARATEDAAFQVLDRYERTLREYHAQRMTLERAADHGE